MKRVKSEHGCSPLLSALRVICYCSTFFAVVLWLLLLLPSNVRRAVRNLLKYLAILFLFPRACICKCSFPCFPPPAARQPGVAVQPPEPGAAAAGGGRGAGPGAVPARRGAAAPAAAGLHPHRSARSAARSARPALLGPRARRGPARAPAAGIRAAARATGTAAPSAGELTLLFCSGPAPTAGAHWGTAALLLFGGRALFWECVL